MLSKIIVISDFEFNEDILIKLRWFTEKNERLRKSFVFLSFAEKDISFFKDGVNKIITVDVVKNEIRNSINYLTENEQSNLKILYLTSAQSKRLGDISKIINEAIIPESKKDYQLLIIDYYSQDFLNKNNNKEELLKIREAKIENLKEFELIYFYLTEVIYDKKGGTQKFIKIEENIEKITSLFLALMNGLVFKDGLREHLNTFGISQLFCDDNKIIEALQLFYVNKVFQDYQNEFAIKSVDADSVQSEIDRYFKGGNKDNTTFIDSENLENLYMGFKNSLSLVEFDSFADKQENYKKLIENLDKSKVSFPISNLFNPFGEKLDFNFSNTTQSEISIAIKNIFKKYEDNLFKSFIQTGQEIADQKKKSLENSIKDKVIDLINKGVPGIKNTNKFSWASAFVTKLTQEEDLADVLRGNVSFFEGHFSLNKAEEPSILFFKKYLDQGSNSITDKLLNDLLDLKNKLNEVKDEIHFRNKIEIGNKKDIVIDGVLINDDKLQFDDWLPDEEIEIKDQVDLREFMTTVENQASIGSCVANAIVGAYEYYINKEKLNENKKRKTIDLSRLFVYYNARAINAKPVRDEGSNIHSAIESTVKYGICEEDVWPYVLENKNMEPSTEAYIKAGKNKIVKAFSISIDEVTIKKCLSSGHPIIFSTHLSKSFGTNKYVTIPKLREEDYLEHSRHAMLLCGYRVENGKTWFIVRNSWGVDWCDKGYCYMPEEYILDVKLTRNHFIININ